MTTSERAPARPDASRRKRARIVRAALLAALGALIAADHLADGMSDAPAARDGAAAQAQSPRPDPR